MAIRAFAPRLRRVLSCLAARARAFPSASAGIAAVEFALVLPVLATMVFGLSDATTGVVIKRKLTFLSRSLADLTSRVPAMTTDEMANIFSASTSIIQPYGEGDLQMMVTSVNVTKVNNVPVGTVDWSCTRRVPETPVGVPPAGFTEQNLTRHPKGSVIPVPAGYEDTQSFIYVETLRPYTPVIGYVITGTFYTRLATPWPVRNVAKVTAPSACPANQV